LKIANIVSAPPTRTINLRLALKPLHFFRMLPGNVATPPAGQAVCADCGNTLAKWDDGKLKAFRMIIAPHHKYASVPVPRSPMKHPSGSKKPELGQGGSLELVLHGLGDSIIEPAVDRRRDGRNQGYRRQNRKRSAARLLHHRVEVSRWLLVKLQSYRCFLRATLADSRQVS
jgi:hypothetical protein